MRATHSSNASSRESIDSDCSKVDENVFEGIEHDMKSLLKSVDGNVRIKTCTPTPLLATTVCISAMLEPPRPITPQHPHPQFTLFQS